jgi:hypothetical protein
MSKQREALKIALKVLNTKQDFNYPEFHALQYQAFNMVYEALAEPEQNPVTDADLYAVWLNGFHSRKPDMEPVAWMCPHDPERETAFAWRAGMCESSGCGHQRVPLYAAPPARKPVYQISLKNGPAKAAWIDVDEADYFSAKMDATYMARCLYAAPPARKPEPEQKPVGIVRTVGGYPDDSTHTVEWLVKHKELRDGDKLYTAPPQRKPLTDSEVFNMAANYYEGYGFKAAEFARAIERAHGIDGGHDCWR